MKTQFETEICSRCHGTGEYSYCEDYGTKCFKCGGAKRVLSKRGAKALAYLNELQTVSIKDLKVGQLIAVTRFTNGGSRFSHLAKVVSIKDEGHKGHWSTTINGVTTSGTTEYMNIVTHHEKYGETNCSYGKTDSVRLYPNATENLSKALAYQDTLTKTGTVRKKTVKSLTENS